MQQLTLRELMDSGIKQIKENLELELKIPSNSPLSYLPGGFKKILLATTWRSGSTFMGEMLGMTPAAFYTFVFRMSFCVIK